MPKEISEVRDRPTEVWIKLLFAVTSVAVVLIAYMGNRVIVGQDKMTEEVSKINVSLQVYGSRISRVEKDVIDVKDAVSKNTDRLYKLEGAK